ncbi:MAG: hypothetical protein JW889_06170 [Verrucomicrobia bacterium]|nr:hypothetical protein [Verrucomicrobiota bacterium]
MSERGANKKAIVGRAVWLVLAVVLSSVCLGTEPTTPATEEPASNTLHVAVIGASVSAGFGCGVKLADVLDVAIESPKTITDLSEGTFFLDPVGKTERIIQALTKDRSVTGVLKTETGPQEVVVTFDAQPPDVVIGLDFLFWFAYGDKDAATREVEMQKAFEFLEKLDCPILVGDVPTFAPSFMLDADQIPSAEELEVLNAMIVEWAKEHENVTVYPLAALVESVRNGEAIELDGKQHTFKPSEIFTIDKLHVTRTGIIAVTSIILKGLSHEGGPLADTKLILDMDEIAEKLEPEEAVAPVEE